MHPKINEYIWYVVVIQLLLSFMAIHKDAETPFDFIGLAIWCTWGTFLLAYIYTKTKRSNKFRAAILGAFTLTSLLAIGLLAFLSVVVFYQGPLNEAGLVFIAFPFGFIKFGVIGALLGVFVYIVKEKLSNKSLENDAL